MKTQTAETPPTESCSTPEGQPYRGYLRKLRLTRDDVEALKTPRADGTPLQRLAHRLHAASTAGPTPTAPRRINRRKLDAVLMSHERTLRSELQHVAKQMARQHMQRRAERHPVQRGRAARPATNSHTQGSRRASTSSRTSSGDDDPGEPEPPPGGRLDPSLAGGPPCPHPECSLPIAEVGPSGKRRTGSRTCGSQKCARWERRHRAELEALERFEPVAAEGCKCDRHVLPRRPRLVLRPRSGLRPDEPWELRPTPKLRPDGPWELDEDEILWCLACGRLATNADGELVEPSPRWLKQYRRLGVIPPLTADDLRVYKPRTLGPVLAPLDTSPRTAAFNYLQVEELGLNKGAADLRPGTWRDRLPLSDEPEMIEPLPRPLDEPTAKQLEEIEKEPAPVVPLEAVVSELVLERAA